MLCTLALALTTGRVPDRAYHALQNESHGHGVMSHYTQIRDCVQAVRVWH